MQPLRMVVSEVISEGKNIFMAINSKSCFDKRPGCDTISHGLSGRGPTSSLLLVMSANFAVVCMPQQRPQSLNMAVN
jgi:hypothetical protein